MIYYKFTDTSLRSLSAKAQAAIDAVSARCSPWSGPEVELKTLDLITIWINSRRLVREADKLRRTGPHNEEMETNHVDILSGGRQLTRQIIGALIERVGVRFFGLEVRLYSTLAAWQYWQQVLELDYFQDEIGYVLAEMSAAAA
jgi:hypothetical protein